MGMMLVFVLILASFLGFELISKVPAQLHTPLMSGSNAISGITVVGAILSLSGAFVIEGEVMTIILGTLSVFFATINVVGGYMVTDRMLSMFNTGKKGDQS
ncbi:NAD(P) transhydrogenase subunit alpha [Halolactibacillus alkaliphilus]|uniref:proton-translocating NAD(P)(+) transhydrogenase n=1 Tax=Halolactibacillus alkaliphilus TaxID=442899 RepID=A0A511WYG5_9BACI|nr:NAD(P) transhydrogenase subunit alpha [Halolactibacillus alkaliphilus]GEN55553.1 NAD(P) transhydrogenase subunit alpha [Halolactibacillus alkaliphilus]GGN64057.1 NAD(P) transhydrogenase subunit alpha [Halolactibacillus alkaliphilus]SFO61919.1 NAD(P) transhydrogenase subunit alpha [Halolactibacillus alkaliphilus]